MQGCEVALRVGRLPSLPRLLLLRLFLLNLHLVLSLLAAQQLEEGSSCPVTGPFSASRTCVVCQNSPACIRETGRFDSRCLKDVAFSSVAQVKAYRCNFQGPPEFAEAVQPGAFIQCNTSSVPTPSQGRAVTGDGDRLGGSCTFGLVAAGDPIVCTATQCASKPNSTALQCQANVCNCSPVIGTGCTSEFASRLVGSLSGGMRWGCKVPPGGLASLTNPAECTWEAAGLPGGSAQAVCDVGECTLPGVDEQEVAATFSEDLGALMKLKRSFTNGEEVLAEWSPNGNPCEWEGVGCFLSYSVRQLFLFDRGLQGKLPSIDTLPSSLTFLDLNGNALSGSIPQDWKLPEGLRQLKLARNRLTGSIPPAWLLPVNLTDLDLAFNQLTGSLPAAWQLPATLSFFSVFDNQLSGRIPAGWVLPSTLNRLALGNNQLSGEAVPEGLVLPDSLEWYEVDVNQLGGNFVEMAARLPPRLRNLALNDNSITGTLPPTWNLPTTMERFSLSDNMMTGSIPSTWKPPPNLYGLYLFNNQFNGTLPSWPELAGLNATVAPNPGLCGAVPPVPEYKAWDLKTSSDFQRSLAYPKIVIEYIDYVNVTVPLRRLPDCAAGNSSAPSSSAPENEVLPIPSNNSEGGRSNVAAIAGVVVGGCMVLVVAGGTLFWRRRRARRRALKRPDDKGLSTEEELEEPESLAQSGRSAAGAGRAATPELEGIGMAGGEDVVAPRGQGRPRWDADDLRHKMARVATQTLPFSDGNPALAGLDQVAQMDTPSLVSSGGARGSTLPSSLSSSVASKDFLASDPLISSIVTHLKSGVGRYLGASSSGSGAGSAPSHSSNTMDVEDAKQPLGRPGEAKPQAQVLGMQHRRRAGTGSSSALSRQLVDVGIWHVDFMDLHLIRQIGSGSFGRVYLAAWQETPVAVKLLLGEAATIGNADEAAKAVLSVSDLLLNNLKKEASLMAALRHPNVLGFMGLCTAPPCLISEYCPRGSLYDTLRSARQFTTRALELTWSIRLQMVSSAAIGMYYLHHFNPAIIHRDLKSNNLLIEENWNTKVADFNLSKIMELGGAEGSSVASSAQAGVGNPRWLAPEVLEGEPHTFASDVFSFGIILWEVLTWEVPWAAVNFWQVIANVQGGQRPPIPRPEDLPGAEKVFVGLDRYVALLTRCWVQKPADRPMFAAIVSELREIQEVNMTGPA